MSTSPLKFNNRSNHDFVTTLRERVDHYFKSNNIKKSANGAMIFKTIFWLTGWMFLYAFIMFGAIAIEYKYILWGILGFYVAMTSVNIAHDAIHGAYSNKTWVNKLLSLTFDMNGASSYMWHFMHNTAHHTYTNVSEYDGDLELLPIIRLSPNQELKAIHKYQHIFSYSFYGLATLFWVFLKDYKKFFENKVGNYNNRKIKASAAIRLFLYKFVYYFMFIGVPLLTSYKGFGLEFLWSFLIMHFVAGVTVAVIFMLAHVVEITHFPIPDQNGSLENSWAVHQLYTTANFAADSPLAAFITGGLNQQVEHHLFPNICSIHYPKLAPIIRETAHEFGIPYLEYPTFVESFRSHVRFLKRVGREKNYEPVIA